ncbi:sialate O-acetylesterase [Kordiimonas sp.]|uniref:sialate O-acetylesterase n=1 Tax=Kordiimonas sp. TaxID=1970157 RepID=UPI003A9553E8
MAEWHFGEGSGTSVADEVGAHDIDLDTPTDPGYTWTTKGVETEDGVVQTPSITGVRTVAMLCRVAKDEPSGFILSYGGSGGNGILASDAGPTGTVHTASSRGVVPIYARASGQSAYRLNRGGWYVLFAELATASNTKLGLGGRHSATTSRCSEFGVAWAAAFSDVLTDAERQRIYLMARKLSASRSFYIDYRDCPTPAKLVAVWGQSNAEGRAKIANLSASDQANASPAGVYVSSRNTLTTAPLVMGTNNQTDAPSTDFGPEMGMAWMAEDDSVSLYLSKYAIGATYLADPGSTSWSIDRDPASSYFNLALRNLWTVEADMLNAGVGPDLAGVCWMQGEQDATSATYGAEYGENLKVFVDKCREQVGDATAKFCVARIRAEDPTFNEDGVASVRRYQEVIGSVDPNMSWIDTDEMTLKVDDVHYDADGMKLLGEAFYADLFGAPDDDDSSSVGGFSPMIHGPRLKPGQLPRLYYQVTTSGGSPKTDLLHTGVTSTGHRTYTNGVASAVVPGGAVVAGSITSNHATGSVGVVNAAAGLYFNDAAVGAASDSVDEAEAVIVLSDSDLVVWPIRHVVDKKTSAVADVIGAPAGDSIAADIAAVKTDTGNLVSRITSTLFDGITSMASLLGVLAGKSTDATALAEINATDGGATYDNTAESLEALGELIESNGAGVGPKTVEITVTDSDDDPIVGAAVRITLDSENYATTTGSDGVATFNVVNDGNWTVVITKQDYSFSGATLTVSGDTTEAYEMTANTPPTPSDPTLCVARVYFALNGTPVEGASVTASLGVDSAADSMILSKSKTSTTTDVSGYAQLELVRQENFTTGTGKYEIKLLHNGITHWSKTVAMPNASSAWIEDLS